MTSWYCSELLTPIIHTHTMKPVYDQQIKKSQSWMMFAKNESGMKNIFSSSAESYDGSNNNTNNLEIV